MRVVETQVFPVCRLALATVTNMVLQLLDGDGLLSLVSLYGIFETITIGVALGLDLSVTMTESKRSCELHSNANIS